MKSHVTIPILLGCFCLLWCCTGQQERGDPTNFDYWYRTMVTYTVGESYYKAYRLLNDYVVELLLKADTDSDEATIGRMVKFLMCAAQNVHHHLHSATFSSEWIGKYIDNKVLQLVLSINQQEKQVLQSQQSMNELNINIQDVQHQVTLAENDVNDKQNSLNKADNEAREAQQAVENARVCGLGRRKKRGFFSDLNPVKIFRDLVGKPACSLLNSGGIDNAKEGRNLAEQTLREAQQRLNTRQQNLADLRTQYGTVQTQINTIQAQLPTLTSQLHEKRNKQLLLTTITKQLKDIEVYLTNVLGSSAVLQDEITRLIDFELVLGPLNAIYHEMLKDNTIKSFSFEISAETARQISANLKKLAQKLPTMPMNMVLTSDMNNVYTKASARNLPLSGCGFFTPGRPLNQAMFRLNHTDPFLGSRYPSSPRPSFVPRPFVAPLFWKKT